MSTALLEPVPNLHTPPIYESLGTSRRGFPEIRLPSGHTALHVTAYSDVKTVLTDTSFLRAETNREGGESWLPTTMPPEMLLNLDMPDHRRMKRLVTGLYSRGGVERLSAVCSQALQDCLDDLDSTDETQRDLVTQVLSPVTIRSNLGFLGIPTADLAFIRPLAREMQMASTEDVPHLLESFWTLYHYIEDLIDGRRPLEDGLLRHLISAGRDADPPLTTSELAATFLGSIVGGDQNVLSSITKMVYVSLAEHDLWDYLAEDPAERVPRGVEELLRLCPLGQISTFPRIASRPLRLTEGEIHAGDVVYADTHRANRDESAFPEPHSIKLDRQGPPHLQFGYGLHHCMGSNMARLEMATILRTLVERYPTMRLRVDADVVPWETGVLVHRPVSLQVTW